MDGSSPRFQLPFCFPLVNGVGGYTISTIQFSLCLLVIEWEQVTMTSHVFATIQQVLKGGSHWLESNQLKTRGNIFQFFLPRPRFEPRTFSVLSLLPGHLNHHTSSRQESLKTWIVERGKGHFQKKLVYVYQAVLLWIKISFDLVCSWLLLLVIEINCPRIVQITLRHSLLIFFKF